VAIEYLVYITDKDASFIELKAQGKNKLDIIKNFVSSTEEIDVKSSDLSKEGMEDELEISGD